MFESITEKFVPQNKESAQSYRVKIGVFQGWVSVLVNGLLFILKLVIGIMVGAVSVIADAIHTLSDVISSSVVIWGFKQSDKPADVEHPYGHGRAEYIATLIIAVLLVVAGSIPYLVWKNMIQPRKLMKLVRMSIGSILRS